MREPGRPDLLACCASTRWADAVEALAPYPTLGELTAAGESALAGLGWDDVLEALAAHPRIGDRAAGSDRESSWSRAEQSGTAHADPALLEALRQGNEAYERRFGHVYLICATGRPAGEMLDLLLARLANDPEVERKIVRDELGKIVKLRLAKLWEGR
ncbi:OHCU decarboxylase [Acrocarpospora phusangensis]|uniref:2-oxo-4-hydroxy-4-carboxy-5-ureidoimidazoline decarboxylase n=1 Tax=Acrocarpospora phusangensis TaxID=1070424 RepID=A0A919UM99_9ACTN|nr:2-oxo-4-hydroxy-4-carboxy-5-ureidoimidazoline decarboxylase [Acrocarpospora phusangensis]GIH23073.1 OHCU decarboxylase [Acrocarpospora phusangensis]